MPHAKDAKGAKISSPSRPWRPSREAKLPGKFQLIGRTRQSLPQRQRGFSPLRQQMRKSAAFRMSAWTTKVSGERATSTNALVSSMMNQTVHLVWADNGMEPRAVTALHLYAKVWNGTDFVEEVPGA